jgi:hypothetical protein
MGQRAIPEASKNNVFVLENTYTKLLSLVFQRCPVVISPAGQLETIRAIVPSCSKTAALGNPAREQVYLSALRVCKLTAHLS